MKTILVNVEALGVKLDDIRLAPGCTFLRQDAIDLNRALYEALEMKFFDACYDDPTALRPFMPATRLDEEPSPYLWSPANWQLGDAHPVELTDYVLTWNKRIMDELDQAIAAYGHAEDRQARIYAARDLAIAAKGVTDDPDMDSQWFVFADKEHVTGLAPQKVVDAVQADPSKWAILRVA